MLAFIVGMCNRLLLARWDSAVRYSSVCAETLRLPLMAALRGICVALGLAQVILLKNMLEHSEQRDV